MAKRVQLVRHDSAGAAAFTGFIGEITVNTSNNSLIVHNAVTPGGFEQARANLSNVSAATVSGAGKMTAAQVSELTTATAGVATNVADIATINTNTFPASGLIVGTTDTQTLTNKTLTTPVINNPTLTLTQSTTPTPTVEGVIEWDTDNNRLAVGDGATTKIFSDDAVVQARANHTGTQLLSTISDSGSLAALNSINNSNWSGTDLAVVNGGTGSSTDTAARTALGVEIGVDVQAFDAGLLSIAGLTTVADRMIYATASDVYAVATLTSFGRSLIDDANAAAARTTLGLIIGTNVQAFDADLTTLAGLAKTNSNFIVGNGSTWVVETGATARTSLGLGALATLSSVNASQIDANAVGQSEIANASVGRGELITATVSMAGALNEGLITDIVLANGYAFFPMIHGIMNDGVRAPMHADNTDGVDPDSPRFALLENGASTGDGSFDVDYRYITA